MYWDQLQQHISVDPAVGEETCIVSTHVGDVSLRMSYTKCPSKEQFVALVNKMCEAADIKALCMVKHE